MRKIHNYDVNESELIMDSAVGLGTLKVSCFNYKLKDEFAPVWGPWGEGEVLLPYIFTPGTYFLEILGSIFHANFPHIFPNIISNLP